MSLILNVIRYYGKALLEAIKDRVGLKSDFRSKWSQGWTRQLLYICSFWRKTTENFGSSAWKSLMWTNKIKMLPMGVIYFLIFFLSLLLLYSWWASRHRKMINNIKIIIDQRNIILLCSAKGISLSHISMYCYKSSKTRRSTCSIFSVVEISLWSF